MTTSVISSLYRPKGAKYECELCGKEAKIRCNECPTYYCCPEHFDHDWRGIRELIAKDTTLLRERTQALGSVEERERGEAELLNIKEEVRHICSETAKGFLIRDECFLAIPGALQALKLTTELFGATSTELVDSYLLLAECNLGIGKLNVAEEFLGLAKWIILKNPDA
ncbi:zinc finger protein MYND domain-containing protein, putative, partial [Perkinsus marinus ATCC 50983]